MSEFHASDFIIERTTQHKAAWYNSHVVYRLMRWDEQSKRRCLEGEHFYLGSVYNKLLSEFGIENPKDVPIVDLDR